MARNSSSSGSSNRPHAPPPRPGGPGNPARPVVSSAVSSAASTATSRSSTFVPAVRSVIRAVVATPRRAFRGRPAGGRRPRHADLGRGFRPGRGSCPLGVGPACRAIGTDAAVAASETFVAAAKANASACSSLARPTVQRPDHHRRRLRGRPPISDPNDQLKNLGISRSGKNSARAAASAGHFIPFFFSYSGASVHQTKTILDTATEGVTRPRALARYTPLIASGAILSRAYRRRAPRRCEWAPIRRRPTRRQLEMRADERQTALSTTRRGSLAPSPPPHHAPPSFSSWNRCPAPPRRPKT